MSKNVAVFVDVANIFYAAKAAGVDIDYVTLLKSASAGRDLVRAYAYTGLDPERLSRLLEGGWKRPAVTLSLTLPAGAKALEGTAEAIPLADGRAFRTAVGDDQNRTRC